MLSVKRTLFFVMMAALLAGCSAIPGLSAGQVEAQTAPPVKANPLVTAEAHVVPRDYSNLVFLTGGDVKEVLVKEGDYVTQGTILARLGDREQYDAQLAGGLLQKSSAEKAIKDLNDLAPMAFRQAELQLLADKQALNDAQLKLDALDTNDYQDQIDNADIEVSNAKDALNDAQDEFDKYKDFSTDNPTRKDALKKLQDAQKAYDEKVQKRDALVSALDQARSAVEMARAKVSDSQRIYDDRKGGAPDPNELKLAQAQLDSANATITAAQAALNNLELKAPYDGTVVAVNIAANEHVTPGQAVIMFADLSELYVETSDLTEMDVVKIENGQAASVEADAISGVSMKGTVERIYDNYREKSGDIVYTVRVRLTDPDPKLRWGMTVKVTFEK